MYEHLKNKTLLVMDRTSLAACAVIRAKEMGIRTVVANFYKTEDSPSKQVADVALEVDISNTDAMLRIIKDYKVDGIFVGWTDSHLPFYAKICKEAGLPCCGTEDQFDILSNDKNKFKEECLKHGVPTPKRFKIDINFNKEDLDKIEYPVMVKPADGSGGRGIKKSAQFATAPFLWGCQFPPTPSFRAQAKPRSFGSLRSLRMTYISIISYLNI